MRPRELLTVLYWDPSGSKGASLGGTGTWANNSGARWYNPNTGNDVVWNNANGDTAVFGGTAGTVTVSGQVSAAGMTFNTTSYVIQSGTLSLPAGGTQINVEAASASISSAIGGTGGMTKLGSGTLTVSGNNTYSGSTAINAGILTASGTSALSSSSTVVLANTAGVTLNLSTNATAGSLAGGGANGGSVTLGSHTLTVGADNTSTTFSGSISGTGGLTKTGSGTLTLNGTNSYTGTTTINAGTLAVSGGTAIADTGQRCPGQRGRGQFQRLERRDDRPLSGGGASGGTVSLGGGTLSPGASNTNTTFSGTIGGTGGLTKVGTGTLTLTNTNTFGGNTTVSAGTLQLGNGSSANGSVAGNIVDNAALSFNNPTDQTYAGNISGTGTVAENGEGTLTLSGQNSNSGNTNINAGILMASGGAASATPASSSWLPAAGPL